MVGEIIGIPLSISPSLDEVPTRVLLGSRDGVRLDEVDVSCGVTIEPVMGDTRPGSDELMGPGIVVSLGPFIEGVVTANGVRVVLRIDVTLSDATVALDANLPLVSCSTIEGVTVGCEAIDDELQFVRVMEAIVPCWGGTDGGVLV